MLNIISGHMEYWPSPAKLVPGYKRFKNVIIETKVGSRKNQRSNIIFDITCYFHTLLSYKTSYFLTLRTLLKEYGSQLVLLMDHKLWYWRNRLVLETIHIKPMLSKRHQFLHGPMSASQIFSRLYGILIIYRPLHTNGLLMIYIPLHT